MSEIIFYVKALIALFVLVNPLVGIPIFLAVAGKEDIETRISIARRASIAVSIILLLSALLGRGILELFGVSIGAFQIGGGIILFLIAVRMVFGTMGSMSAKAPSVRPGSEFAIVPLAIPLMAGPGAISGAILYGTRMRSILEMGILTGIILLVGIATYGSLRAAQMLAKYLKDAGISVATSVMGLIIAAIAVEMIAHGVASMFILKILGGTGLQ